MKQHRSFSEITEEGHNSLDEIILTNPSQIPSPQVHHKEEARARAALGPLPWFQAVDTTWVWLVKTGSAAAAAAARRG